MAVRLYAHYGGEAPGAIPKQLTIDELKQALTENKRKPKPRTIRHYDDFASATLAAFVEHFTIEEGCSLHEQRALVSSTLCEALACTLEDVTDLHYADAFVRVMDVAMESDPTKRILTRAEFVRDLDKQPAMFTRWHRAFLGRERYLKAVKRRIKALGLLDSKLRRMLVLGQREIGAGTSSTDVGDLIASVASVGFGAGKLPTARPWTVVLETDEEGLRDVKIALLARDVMLHDGFESLLFCPKLFDRDVLVNTKGSKIARVSYDLRVVGRSTLERHAGQLSPPGVLLSFTDQPVALNLGGDPRRLDVAGCDIEQIAELLGAFA